MPAPQFVTTGGLRVAKQEPPLGVTVSERNWNRWGRHLRDLRDPVPFAKDAMLLAIGLIPTGVLSLVAWIPNFAQLPSKAQADYWWVTPVILGLTLAALVIAGVMRLTMGAVADRLKRDADLLWDDMNHAHAFGSDETESGNAQLGRPSP